MLDVGSLEIGAPYFLLRHHAGDPRLPLIRTLVYTGEAAGAFAFEDPDEDEPIVFSSEEVAQRLLDRAELIARLKQDAPEEDVVPVDIESLVEGAPYFVAVWDSEGVLPFVTSVLYEQPGALDDGTPVCFFRRVDDESEARIFVYAADMGQLVCTRAEMIQRLALPPEAR